MGTEKARNSAGALKAPLNGGNAKHQQLRPSWLTEIISFILCTTSPFVVIYYWIAYRYFDTSIVTAAKAVYSEGPFQFFATRLPHSSADAILGYAGWLTLQAILYIYLPGSEALGPVTPAGRRLKYKLNGLAAWGATVVLWAVGSVSGIIDPACIAKNWEGLVWTINVFSVVAVPRSPYHAQIFCISSFLNRHCSDLSFAAYQYQSHGYLTNTMVAVVILRVFVVVDFFINELWFFHTLDGMYESFGFYNIYGFSAMMPVLWSLQTQYLAKRPDELSTIALMSVILLFLAGWLIRFSADYQKVKFRQTGGECRIWGNKANKIRASYQTADGKLCHSLLLCSGWWGLARHANYTGSAMYTLALCAACGRGGIFPYTEAIIVGGMVIHRCHRDEGKCAAKYGKDWDEYCRQVQWRMIPGIY
ncbi:ergosterol biosynthesis ERG4/ERG24 family-domain-containing protein, partial [Aspergillus minisclerotigenes]